ncbi:MAG: glycosyltransferase, partial [Victivallales bacterium]|nr:glycosyltransferase [Victivallales bacterium]
MMEYEKEKTTICVVNYKTEELTRLCLRSIRKFTKAPYKVVVVDNDSGDASLDYLRSLDWITLIERSGEMKGSGSWAHGTGLDKGLKICDTEFFMAMHSDTFVRREGWLSELRSLMSSETACVGGGKLDLKPRWQVLLKKLTDIKKLKRKLTEKKRLDFYIRTICSLYRTKILHDENLTFAMNV